MVVTAVPHRRVPVPLLFTIPDVTVGPMALGLQFGVALDVLADDSESETRNTANLKSIRPDRDSESARGSMPSEPEIPRALGPLHRHGDAAESPAAAVPAGGLPALAVHTDALILVPANWHGGGTVLAGRDRQAAPGPQGTG